MLRIALVCDAIINGKAKIKLVGTEEPHVIIDMIPEEMHVVDVEEYKEASNA